MDEPATVEIPTPIKKEKRRGRPPGSQTKKHKQRPLHQAKPAPQKLEAPKVEPPPSPYAGMTRMNCADACVLERCVVSHRAYCAHPRKGGLQRIDLMNKEALARLNAAKELLGPG